MPVPVCRLRHSQRLIGIDVVGGLTLRNVLCQTNGRRSNRHGVGVSVHRQRVDDVSYNGIRAGLRLQALNDERFLAVGAAGRTAIHALHVIAGTRPPWHRGNVGVGGRVKRGVGVEVDGLVDRAADGDADDGLDAHVLRQLVHGRGATVGTRTAAHVTHDDGRADQQVICLFFGQQDTGNAGLGSSSLVLEVVACAALQRAGVALFAVLQLEHVDAERDVADGDTGIVRAALAPLGNLRVVAVGVVQRGKASRGRGFASGIQTAHVLRMNHERADRAIGRDALRQREVTGLARGAVILPPVHAVIDQRHPCGFLRDTDHAVRTGAGERAVNLVHGLDFDFAVGVDLILALDSPERELLAVRVCADDGIGAGLGCAERLAGFHELTLRGLRGCEVIELYAEGLVALQQIEPTGEQLGLGVVAVISAVPPRNEHIVDVLRSDVSSVEAVIDGCASRAGQFSRFQTVGGFQRGGNFLQRLLGCGMGNELHNFTPPRS